MSPFDWQSSRYKSASQAVKLWSRSASAPPAFQESAPAFRCRPSVPTHPGTSPSTCRSTAEGTDRCAWRLPAWPADRRVVAGRGQWNRATTRTPAVLSSGTAIRMMQGFGETYRLSTRIPPRTEMNGAIPEGCRWSPTRQVGPPFQRSILAHPSRRTRHVD